MIKKKSKTPSVNSKNESINSKRNSVNYNNNTKNTNFVNNLNNVNVTAKNNYNTSNDNISESVSRSKYSKKNIVDEHKFANYLKLNYYLENNNIKHLDKDIPDEAVEVVVEEDTSDKLFLQIKSLYKKPLKQSSMIYYNNSVFMLKGHSIKKKHKKKNFSFQVNNLKTDKNNLLGEGSEQMFNIANSMYDIDMKKNM